MHVLYDFIAYLAHLRIDKHMDQGWKDTDRETNVCVHKPTVNVCYILEKYLLTITRI
jgi:hypothetical protein